jgi:hypothetical protein
VSSDWGLAAGCCVVVHSGAAHTHAGANRRRPHTVGGGWRTAPVGCGPRSCAVVAVMRGRSCARKPRFIVRPTIRAGAAVVTHLQIDRFSRTVATVALRGTTANGRSASVATVRRGAAVPARRRASHSRRRGMSAPSRSACARPPVSAAYWHAIVRMHACLALYVRGRREEQALMCASSGLEGT